MDELTHGKRITVSFYRSETGREPVREWLLELRSADRRTIGEDLKTTEFGWPIGMPVCRQMKGHRDLYEVRSNLSDGKIGRVLFTISGTDMVLLHGFIKKSQKTPQGDLDVALQRQRRLAR